MMKTLRNSLATLLFALALTPATFADTREGTTVEFKALPSYVTRVFLPVVPQRENVLAIDNLPAEEVIQAPAGFDVRIVNGRVVAYSDGGDGGGYAVVRMGGREVTLTLVSVVPYERVRNGKLDGYTLGQYAKPLKGLESYEPPKGFVRLTDETASLRVSDHYRMQDFQCKLDGTTKYLIVRPEALLKLEILQHELEAKHGLQFSRFTVMSGYRTPYYNARIGNETAHSRHLYGDAMDIYVDENGDGNMDDVNRDGRVNTDDARFLLRVAASIDESQEWSWLKGGAGVYDANAAHGPYIHVDARGYVARWGSIEEPSKRAGVMTGAR